MVFLYASDDNFAGILACSLKSLFEAGNADGSKICIVDGGISEKHASALLALAGEYGAQLHLVPAPDIEAYCGGNVEIGRYSMSMFSRIFADVILPDENRVIYLDCDTIITQNLFPLWETDLHGKPVGAVNDLRSSLYGRNLGMSAGTVYINSGVLLINLDAYRRDNCRNRIMDALAAGNGLLEFPDNDIICSVLQHEIQLLPCRYNAISTLFAYSYGELDKFRKPEQPLAKNDYNDAVTSPAIIHYTRCFWFMGRPWDSGCTHPHTQLFTMLRQELEDKFTFPRSRMSTKDKLIRTIRALMPRRATMLLSSLVHSWLKPLLAGRKQKAYCEYIKKNRRKTALILRTQAVNADSRAEKEAYSLMQGGYNPVFLGWNRDKSGKIIRKNKRIFGSDFTLFQIRIKGKYFQGFRKNLIPMLRFQLGMRRFIKKNREGIDLLHACDLDTALLASSLSKKYDIPMIYDVYDYYPDGHAKKGSLMYRMLTGLERRTEKQAEAVIVCTEERMAQIFPEICRRTEVIHNALPQLYVDNAVKSAVVKDNGLVHIVFIGAIIRGRYLDEMIDTVITKSDCFDMYVGGFGSDGMIDSIKKTAAENENIHFLGFLQYQEVISIESCCDIIPAVFDPTIGNHRYAAPNKFYEAVALGKPLIMLHDTGMDGQVSGSGIGVVINGETPEEFRRSFAEALDLLIDKKDEWPAMAGRSRKLYAERFSWEIMEKRLIRLYDEVLSHNE